MTLLLWRRRVWPHSNSKNAKMQYIQSAAVGPATSWIQLLTDRCPNPCRCFYLHILVHFLPIEIGFDAAQLARNCCILWKVLVFISSSQKLKFNKNKRSLSRGQHGGRRTISAPTEHMPSIQGEGRARPLSMSSPIYWAFPLRNAAHIRNYDKMLKSFFYFSFQKL